MTSVKGYHAAGAPAAKAAPAGGAGVFGRLCRGCSISRTNVSRTNPVQMLYRIPSRPGRVTLAAALLALGVSAPAVEAQILSVSGIDVVFHDEIQEPPTYRVRYLAPALQDGELDYDSVADDMQQLCSMDALPRLLQAGATPTRVVVTLMSKPVEFGAMDRDARQFFESYTVEGDLCIWEAF